MASLRHVPRSPYWIAIFRLPDGRQTNRSTGTKDKREAQRIANSFEDAAKAGGEGRLTEHRARKTIADIFAIANRDQLPGSSIKDYFEAWLKRKEIETTEGTFSRYEVVVEKVLRFLGPKARKDLIHLSSKEIVAFRDHLIKRVAPGTVNMEIKILRSALAQAKRDGLVDFNEAERVSLVKKRKVIERRPFTIEELRKILDVVNEEWKGMILVGLYTGLRLGDVAQLTWANLDLQREELTVRTIKTGRRQILPLAKPLMNFVGQLPVDDNPESPLFPEAAAIKQRTPKTGTLSNQFHRILVAAGLANPRPHRKTGNGRDAARELEGLSFHCLRHTATSLLKNAGVSDVVARDIIGHESAAVSRQYTHIDTDTKRKAVEQMPDVTIAQ